MKTRAHYDYVRFRKAITWPRTQTLIREIWRAETFPGDPDFELLPTLAGLIIISAMGEFTHVPWSNVERVELPKSKAT